MTNQPASGNDTARAEMLEYIADRQTEVMILHDMLSALEYLDNEGACKNECTSLIMTARRMAHDLNVALDSVNLPDVEATK